MEKTRSTRNADYIKEQQIRKPGVSVIRIKAVKGHYPIWDKPHLLGSITRN